MGWPRRRQGGCGRWRRWLVVPARRPGSAAVRLPDCGQPGRLVPRPHRRIEERRRRPRQPNQKNLEQGSKEPYPTSAMCRTSADRAMSTVDREKLAKSLIADRENAQIHRPATRQAGKPVPGSPPPPPAAAPSSPRGAGAPPPDPRRRRRAPSAAGRSAGPGERRRRRRRQLAAARRGAGSRTQHATAAVPPPRRPSRRRSSRALVSATIARRRRKPATRRKRRRPRRRSPPVQAQAVDRGDAPARRPRCRPPKPPASSAARHAAPPRSATTPLLQVAAPTGPRSRYEVREIALPALCRDRRARRDDSNDIVRRSSRKTAAPSASSAMPSRRRAAMRCSANSTSFDAGARPRAGGRGSVERSAACPPSEIAIEAAPSSGRSSRAPNSELRPTVELCSRRSKSPGTADRASRPAPHEAAAQDRHRRARHRRRRHLARCCASNAELIARRAGRPIVVTAVVGARPQRATAASRLSASALVRRRRWRWPRRPMSTSWSS